MAGLRRQSRMTTLRLLLAGLLAALGLVALTPATAQACSCATGDVADFAEWSDTVFTGTLVEVRQPPEARIISSTDPVGYVFEVDETYEGEPAATAEVTTARSSASCGLEGLRVGTAYVVFAATEGTGLTTTSCSGTREAHPGFVDRVEQVLGPGSWAPDTTTAADDDTTAVLALLLRWLGWA